MDRRIVAAKLDALRRTLGRIEAKTPATLAALQTDEDLQDVLVLNLAKAVQTCVDIGAHLVADSDAETPRTMGAIFQRLEQMSALSKETSQRLRRSVGFRNIAIHRYDDIDWQIVLDVCHHSVEDLRQFAAEIARFAGFPEAPS